MSNKKFRHKLKKLIHPFLVRLISLKRTVPISIIGSENISNKTVLIVSNHYCIDDMMALAEAFKKHFYLLVSTVNKYGIYRILLNINGTQWIDRTNKNSRKNAMKCVVNGLKNGINYAMYPEATWNLSENRLMLPMNWGCIKIAKEANVAIQPVICLFTEDKWYTVIGKLYYPSDDIEGSIIELRDIMATLLFKQIETNYYEKRDNDNIKCLSINGVPYYYEKRNLLPNDYCKSDWLNRYRQYSRTRKKQYEVKKYESQFIYEPKSDDYSFFIIFNSSIRCDKKGNIKIKRISSEKNGYMGTNIDSEDYQSFFGYSYNEFNL